MINAEDMKCTDREKFVSLNVTILKLCGQWFYNWKRPYLELSLKLFVVCFMYVFPIIGEIGYLAYNRNNVAQIAEGMYLMVIEVAAVIILILLHMQGDVIVDLMRDINNEEFAPKSPDHENISSSTARTARVMISVMLFNAFYGIAGMVFIFHCTITEACLMPLFMSIRVHPTNMGIPGVDVHCSPIYEIVYFYQVLYKPLSAQLYCSVQLLPAAFMFFAIEQLKILAFDLENMSKSEDGAIQEDREAQDKCMSEAMRQCIRRHQFILDYVSKVQRAFTASLATVFILTGIILCLAGIKIISMGSPRQNLIDWLWTLTFLANVTYSIYATSYAGNEVILKSEALMTAAFNSPWVEASSDYKLLILTFRERCMRPMVLEAGFVCRVTLGSFTNFLNWTYKAYAILNTMDE